MAVGMKEVIATLKQELEDAKAARHPHIHFDMGIWVGVVERTDEKPTLCKTAACLAGTAVLLKLKEQGRLGDFFTFEPARGGWVFDDDAIDWTTEGAEILGIDDEMGHALFDRCGWPPEHFGVVYEVGADHNPHYTLEKAIAMLELIQAGRLTYDEDAEEAEDGEYLYSRDRWSLDGVRLGYHPTVDSEDDNNEGEES